MLLALLIRIPVTKLFKQELLADITIVLISLLLMSTIVGTIQFFELTDPDKNKSKTTAVKDSFQLKDEYLVHGIVLLLIPWSFLCILLIIAIKMLCFINAEGRRRWSRRYGGHFAGYGEFEDEQIDDEAVVSVYLDSLRAAKCGYSFYKKL